MAQVIVWPGSVVAGPHQQDSPLAVDGTNYQEPGVIATSTAGYLQADGLANSQQNGQLQLPLINNPPLALELVGTSIFNFARTGRTSITLTVPSGPDPVTGLTVQAGDFIELMMSTQQGSGQDPGAPAAPSGLTLRQSTFFSAAFKPRISKYYRFAVGDEGGDTYTFQFGQSVWTHGVVQVWRGVDPEQPYDLPGPMPAVIGSTGSNPNPPAVTPVTEGAMITTNVVGNFDNSGFPANVSPGYSVTVNAAPQERAFVNAHRLVTAAAADPGAYAWQVQNWTAVTDVLRPRGGSVSAILIVAVGDQIATNLLGAGNAPAVAARNEIQRITGLAGLGSFTLRFNGETSSVLTSTASAADVQAALESMPGIGPLDVSVTGGDLNNAPIDVEFIGAYAQTNVGLMTSGSTNVTIEQIRVGTVATPFTLAGPVNVPRAGGVFQPQAHVWVAEIENYVSGKEIDMYVAEVDGLHTWTAVLLITENVDLASPLVFGPAVQGLSNAARFGTMTPPLAGAKLLGVSIKGLGGNRFYPGPPPTIDPPSVPVGLTLAAESVSDAQTMSVFITAPLDSVPYTPGDSSWTADPEKWASGVFALRPFGSAAAGAGLSSVLDAEDETQWMEIAGAAARMDEILEFDLASLGSDAVIISAAIEFAHEAPVRNKLRATLVGIKDDGTVVPADPHADGYEPVPVSQVQTVLTPEWRELGDTSSLMDYSRLGVRFWSTEAHPVLTTHKVYWVKAVLEVEAGGPVINSITPPALPGDSISWDYSSASGLEQSHYQVKVIAGPNGDPDTEVTTTNVLEAPDGDLVYDSGKVVGPLERSLLFVSTYGKGNQTIAVRAWARTDSGVEIRSRWLTINHNLTGTAPAVPSAVVPPLFNEETGSVDLSFTTPQRASRAFLIRSADGGATWKVTGGSPYAVTESTPVVLQDASAQLGAQLLYKVAVDSGPMSEHSFPTQFSTVPVDTTARTWFLQSPSTPALNRRIDIVAGSLSITRRRRAVVSEQPGSALVAHAPRLGDQISFGIRVLNNAERVAIEALLASPDPMRLVDILGREWTVRPVEDQGLEFFRLAPLPEENTGLRDSHIYTVTFREVRS